MPDETSCFLLRWSECYDLLQLESTLSGILLKSRTTSDQSTTKLIGIHGWLDNLNSLLPLAERLISRHSNYEIYLYDRAGHGFSSHIPRGFDYSLARHHSDLRHIIQILGWGKEKFSIIGHSYGATLGMMYAASYPDEVSCVIALDALPRSDTSLERFSKLHGARIDASLQHHQKQRRTLAESLTFNDAVQLIKFTRPGLTDEAARLLAERSVRQDSHNRLQLTRDESLKLSALSPVTDDIIRSITEDIRASVLFIGAINPQWPRPQTTIDLCQKHIPNFEATFFDGPHHFHMTHVNEVVNLIEQYFDKHLQRPSVSTKPDSPL